VRRVRIIERANDLAKVRQLWEEIASSARFVQPRAAAPTLFQSYAWNEIAARLFAGRERPHVVVAESDSGAAIIPACVRGDFVSLLGEELFDYRDVIVCGDEALLDRAWQKVADLALPVEIKAVRGERTWAEMRTFAGAPCLPASKPVKRNKGLERNLRLLRERGCESGHRAIGPSGDQIQIPRRNDKRDVCDLVRRMYELKARHESGSLFRDPLRIEAVVEMAVSAPSEVFTIEHDDEWVAAALVFIDRNVCRFYGTYYDPRWARFSPGVSLLYRVIQHAQARGLDFDFMTGEQAYKMRFASDVVPLYVAQRPVVEKMAA
jgi:CelD/BcsL family acetyltransferase involved in cellulose biosynthesis